MFQSFLMQSPGRTNLSSSDWIQTRIPTTMVTYRSQSRWKSEMVLQSTSVRQYCSFPDTHFSTVSQWKDQKGLHTLILDVFPSYTFEGSLVLLHSKMSQTWDPSGDGRKCHPLGLVSLRSRKSMCPEGGQGKTDVFKQILGHVLCRLFLHIWERSVLFFVLFPIHRVVQEKRTRETVYCFEIIY